MTEREHETDVKSASTESVLRYEPVRNNSDKDNATKSAVLSISKIPEVDQFSDFYNMNHYKRGTAIIFNHYVFNDYRITTRKGTQKDCQDLLATLSDLKFDVAIYNDLSYVSICETLLTFSKADHSDSDCLVVVVLSHGDTGTIQARDREYPVDTLWKPFAGNRCASLVGKPKIFFIQACRGDQVDDGVLVQSPIEADAPPSPRAFTIPALADILVMYSSFNGFCSFKGPDKGSWFIQSLCAELKNNARNKDLTTILAFVNRRMAVMYESYIPSNPDFHAKKQIGTIVSTFTRLLYFYPPTSNP